MSNFLEMIQSPNYNDFLVPTIDFLFGLLILLVSVGFILSLLRYVLLPFKFLTNFILLPVEVFQEWRRIVNQKKTQMPTNTTLAPVSAYPTATVQTSTVAKNVVNENEYISSSNNQIPHEDGKVINFVAVKNRRK